MATRELLPASEKLVSSTDSNGTILNANKGFVDIIGFQSVRICPQERHVNSAEILYDKLQTPGSESRKLRGLSLKFKAGLAYLLSVAGVTLSLSLPGLGAVTSFVLALLSVMAGSGWLL